MFTENIHKFFWNILRYNYSCELTPLQEIFDRCRVKVFKNGVRTPEFFKDFNKRRSGIITEIQFNRGLSSLALGKEAQLLRADIQKVVEFYRCPDESVAYKEFCDMLENGKSLWLKEWMACVSVYCLRQSHQIQFSTRVVVQLLTTANRRRTSAVFFAKDPEPYSQYSFPSGGWIQRGIKIAKMCLT